MEQLFFARLVFQIRVGHTEKVSFEEQLRMYHANDTETVYEQANLHGKQEEITLPQDDHAFVSWEFLGVTEIYESAALSNGSLVDSRTIEPGRDPDYEPYIRQKIRLLRNKIRQQKLVLPGEL